MEEYMDAVILAGGENKRMPVVKGFLELNNCKIIESSIGILKKIFQRVFISTNSPELYFYLGAPMVGDIIPFRGPMTGIFSVLNIPDVSAVFVTACDMPYINVILTEYMAGKWNDAWDAVIPVYDNKPQPLPGIYSKRITGYMEESIKNGRRSLRYFLKDINVLYIDEREVKSMDAEGKTFVNINTMEDYKREGGKTCLV
jgi:molybdopterin-guanine dinucleotide biosynthesis protein A